MNKIILLLAAVVLSTQAFAAAKTIPPKQYSYDLCRDYAHKLGWDHEYSGDIREEFMIFIDDCMKGKIFIPPSEKTKTNTK